LEGKKSSATSPGASNKSRREEVYFGIAQESYPLSYSVLSNTNDNSILSILPSSSPSSIPSHSNFIAVWLVSVSPPTVPDSLSTSFPTPLPTLIPTQPLPTPPSTPLPTQLTTQPRHRSTCVIIRRQRPKICRYDSYGSLNLCLNPLFQEGQSGSVFSM
jgi:hypothetical protein